jgi:hypothetical protein
MIRLKFVTREQLPPPAAGFAADLDPQRIAFSRIAARGIAWSMKRPARAWPAASWITAPPLFGWPLSSTGHCDGDDDRRSVL